MSRLERLPAMADHRHQRGVALVAVLWMVGGLSLLSAAIASAVSTEIRIARQFAGHAQAAALGDAAVRLAALDLLYGGDGAEQDIRTGEYHIEGRKVLVRALPAAGFINLNTASEELLESMFFHAAEANAAGSALLARRVVRWRMGLDPEDDGPPPRPALDRDPVARPQPGRFAVPEDLLQVPGLDWRTFERVRGLLTVHPSGATGVNPRLAKPEVLLILARGNAEVVEAIVGRRKAGDPLVDFTGLEQRHLSSSTGAAWRIEAFVPGGQGRHLLRAQWVMLLAHERMPWRTLTVEPVIAAAPAL